MGTYNYSAKELAEEIKNALDNVEGDFDRETLNSALMRVGNEYKYVSDEIINEDGIPIVVTSNESD